MKKLIALIAVLALACTAALAATYNDHDIAFEYDDASFEITMDDHTDDEDLVILSGKNEAWGNAFIKLHLRDLEDGEAFPTMDDFAEMVEASNTEVTQDEWNGFRDVFMYTVDYGDSMESYFIAPVEDDDGEIDAILTVVIGVDRIDDEEAGMARDDTISAVLDTLKVDD